jgi:hypothetical protein
MATIHELMLFYCENGQAYPKPIETVRLGLFTTVDKAETVMHCQLAADQAMWSPESVVEFTLEEIALDQEPCFRRLRYYDATGTFKGEIALEQLVKVFKGRESNTCRFRCGDLVEFIHGDKLQIGIVAGLPLSPDEAARFGQCWEVRGDDDCYHILVGEDDHDHPRECELFRPRAVIDEKTKEVLIARFQGFSTNEKQEVRFTDA